VTPGSAGRLVPRRGKSGRGPSLQPRDRVHELQEFYQDCFLPLVRRAHWHHHLSHEDASDVVQEAFLLAIERLDTKQNPKLWIKRVVDNLALNLVRKNARRKRLLARWQSPVPAETETE
jgi:DNA-directed RNA polymerase specialized sigma24 family protein